MAGGGAEGGGDLQPLQDELQHILVLYQQRHSVDGGTVVDSHNLEHGAVK